MDMSDLGLPDTVFVTLRGEARALHDLAPPDHPPRTVALDLGARHAPGFWALQLDRAIRELAQRSVIVAQGVAALAFAHWALLSPRIYLSGIAGAILVAPGDAPEALRNVAATLAIGPVVPLPFASIVLADLRAASLPETLALAKRWGSQLIDHKMHEADEHDGAFAAAGLSLASAFGAPRPQEHSLG